MPSQLRLNRIHTNTCVALGGAARLLKRQRRRQTEPIPAAAQCAMASRVNLQSCQLDGASRLSTH